MSKGMMTVLKPEDMPKVPHFVILYFKSRHIPGSKRSEMYPGPGYMARDEPYTEYRWTSNRDVWIEEITKLSLDNTSKGKFVSFRASERATIDLKAQVFVKSP